MTAVSDETGRVLLAAIIADPDAYLARANAVLNVAGVPYRFRRFNLDEVKSARSAAPVAQEPVTYRWPKALAIYRDTDDQWHCDISFAAYPTDDELAALHDFLNTHHKHTSPPATSAGVVTANVGRWLSAALDDPQVCDEMKADILAWMEAGKPNVQPSAGVGAEEIARAYDMLAVERQRQIDQEGWHYKHDDAHDDVELLRAAMCYLNEAICAQAYRSDGKPLSWPWDDCWWKPTTAERNLVKAGALLLAERDRLNRIKAYTGHVTHKIILVVNHLALALLSRGSGSEQEETPTRKPESKQSI